MALLELRRIIKRFGGLVAVDKLDLDLPEHAIYSVIGPNGAGKTTVFNCITGFYRPEAGDILLNGQSVVGLSPDRITRKGITRTYQNIRLFNNMTALENILVGLHPHLHSNVFGAIFQPPSVRR